MPDGGTIMADWFKMYEDGLNEERLLSVMVDEPLVLGIWVWVLTQCCKDKSDTFDMSDRIKSGAIRKLNVSLDTFDTAMNLLNEIGYIYLGDEQVTVPQWDTRQSDYIKRSVRTPTVQCSSRGEKSRGEKRRKYSKAFESFWEHYPRKQNKAKAMDAWKKMGCDEDANVITEAIKKQSRTIFADKEMQHIPHGSTWINGERWEDDISSGGNSQNCEVRG